MDEIFSQYNVRLLNDLKKMDPNSTDCSSSLVDSIRKTGVSRRGGVRVRGGRLPPIRIRDSALISAPSKKVVAPKIPQRRIQVKDEVPNSHGNFDFQTSANAPNSAPADSRQKSSQGRGRGPKVYLQSEGTFLGEGPALKLKKELQTSSYERGSRCSKSKEGDVKFDASRLKYLFENYDEDETYNEHVLLPVRFPILKQELKQEIKEEIKIEIKEEIKEEDLEADDVKLVIKKEPDDSSTEISESEETKIVEQLKKVEISEKGKRKPFDDDIKFMKGENTFILLQLPSCLPFKKASGNSNQSTTDDKSTKTSNRNEDSEAAPPETDLKNLSEGHIGKLQILRSGEMRLVSGSVTMSIERTMEVPTVCEVVSIPIGNSQQDGDIIELGRIERKLIMRPLLDNITDESGSKNDIY